MTLTFEIPGPAVPKARARRGKGGHHYTPQRTRDYETHVATRALVARQRRRAHFGGESAWPLDARYRLEVAVPRDTRGDLDNVLKSIEDACNGVLWGDDRQIDDTRCYRADVPCVCVRVEVLR